MPRGLRSLVPRPATIVAVVALAVALSGTAAATTTIGTGQIKDGTLLARDFTPGELVRGQVQGARMAAVGGDVVVLATRIVGPAPVPAGGAGRRLRREA